MTSQSLISYNIFFGSIKVRFPFRSLLSLNVALVYSNKFSSKLKKLKNPYYKKNSIQNVINVIKSTRLDKILIKKFYDIKF